MKVLLLSPKDPDKPGELKFLVGGENTYTRSLLSHPPLKVEYLHQDQALKEGKIAYTGFQKQYSLFIKGRILPLDAGIQAVEIKEKFDLIHCHAYCLKPKNYSGPVILSDSSSNILFLKDYLGWGKTRIKCSYFLRKLVSEKFNIYDPNLNLYKTDRLIVWSEFGRRVHIELGCNPEKIVVIPPGIEPLPGEKIRKKHFNILFVGIWFKRKGGDLLLQAFRILKEKYPNINLTIIGELSEKERLPKGTWQKDFVPREELIKEIFPKADVLVLIPPVSEGYGLVVLEAASLGIPAIVSSIYALPELVDDGKTGFVIKPGSIDELLGKLDILINHPDLGLKMGEKAKERFFKEFWIEETNKKLLKVYCEALKK